MTSDVEPLVEVFKPIHVGPVVVRNRIFVSAHLTNYARDGLSTSRLTDYYAARAMGGAGLIFSESVSIHPSSRHSVNCIDLWWDEACAGLQEICAAVHAHGARFFVQLLHTGRQQDMVNSVSGPMGPSATRDPAHDVVPHEMSQQEIRTIVSAFADAAERAVAAGADGIEIHCTNGYLLQQFLSPWSNLRKDEYGGDFAGRLRIVGEIIEVTRQRIGSTAAIGARIAADEYVDNGIDEDLGLEIGAAIGSLGVDFLSVASGVHSNIHTSIPPMGTPAAPLREFCGRLKTRTSVPVLTSHRIKTLQLAEEILQCGQADMVNMARAHIADPFIVAKAMRGAESDIRPCIGCMQGCVGRAAWGMTCLVNPAVGTAAEVAMEPTTVPLRIAVVGGGPAGMQAALTLARRGHATTLFEAQAELGGALRLAASLPGRHEFQELVEWQKLQLSRDVAVRLNTRFETEMSGQFDTIVVASGAHERVASSSFPCDSPVYGLQDAMTLEGLEGKGVLIVDSADHRMKAFALADKMLLAGAKPIIVAMGASVGAHLDPVNRSAWKARPDARRVRTVSFGKVDRVAGGVAHMSHEGWQIDVDGIGAVVLIEPQISDDLGLRLAQCVRLPIHVIGDAFAPRTALEAMHHAHEVAMKI
ncbi:MAG TPA: FAD-dependent oxidoreductase [Burkholderiaceae bacterium]|nr:FAD-dependent oxidoreductase [Burkholderiaceae bacterium]